MTQLKEKQGHSRNMFIYFIMWPSLQVSYSLLFGLIYIYYYYEKVGSLVTLVIVAVVAAIF